MFIAGTEFNIHRKCLEFYLCGCKKPHCPGCHNEALWDFVPEDNINEYKRIISDKVKTGMINEFWILGGEPLDQDLKELEKFIIFLKTFDKDVWLWTRYVHFHLKFLHLLDYIKIGKYTQGLESYTDERFNITLASSNQKIIKLKKD